MDISQLSPEILSQLEQIKWILASILTFFVLGVIGIAVLTILVKKKVDDESDLNTFRDRMSDLLDKDDLDGVIKACKEKLEKYPKNMYAHWYISQAYFRKKEYHKALEALMIISENAPSWREHYVEPCIEEIKEEMQDTKPEIVK